MEEGLITIITPCYNTGAIVHRLLDSILLQDYPKVEMYAIDDGSVDDTEKVLKSYIPKFEAKGYSLAYIYQSNQGQSAAINNGLKYIKGEYLIWPDSDDFFRTPDALSIFVSSLGRCSDEYGVVRCLPVHVDEDTLLEEPERDLLSAYRCENQFKNCLLSTNFFWGAGDYLIRTSALDNVNPQREIYVEKNAGQNWQILLPILYSYKCMTIEKSVYCVLMRSDSHSRGQYKTYQDQIKKIHSYRNTIINTIDSIVTMPKEERIVYKDCIIKKYKVEEYRLAVQFNNKKDIKALALELKTIGEMPSLLDRMLWKYDKDTVFCFFLRAIKKIIR